MNDVPTIAIIGGGFCGTVTLIQLAKQSTIPLNIILVNKNNPPPKGVAFGSYNPSHVLNVPAAKMSALTDDPDNFINWIKSKQEYAEFVNDELNDKFLPRIIYGHYLQELFHKTIDDYNETVNVKVVDDEAIDIIPDGDGMKIMLKKNDSFKADKVVLALGNFLPDDPKIDDKDFYKSGNYFQNPWQKEAIENLDDIDNILIIGTGLTMVDNVLSLLEKGFKGKIYAVSTKGFFPLSHKKRKPYTDILDELHPPYEISQLYHLFRKHIKYVLLHGITGEAVVDAVRPKTQEIWLSFSLQDKKRFMTHIRHLWGVARHRLPKEIFDQMQELISNGKLKIIGGRLKSIRESNNNINVILKERKTQRDMEFTVNRVINCTGPKTDIQKIEEPLIINLLRRGLIAPDDMKLGINALPDGTVMYKDHSVSSMLFTIGSMLKGILWESTAVPELRVQANNLAGQLLKQLDAVDTLKI